MCAPTGTTSLTKLQQVKGPIVVTAANHTGCLVLLPAGQGRRHHRRRHRARRPRRPGPQHRHHEAKAITAEPYGLGLNKADVYLARYVNRVIADLEADGEWKAIYNRWLAAPLGPAPAPPTPVYGR